MKKIVPILGVLGGVVLGVYYCEVKPTAKVHRYEQLDSEAKIANEKQRLAEQGKKNEEEYTAKYDVLNFRIDGKLDEPDSKIKMIALLGKPTRTVTYTPDCDVSFFKHDSTITSYYYRGAEFEENDKMDSVALERIVFGSTNMRLVCPQIILSKNTQLDEMAAAFPKSFGSKYPIHDTNSKTRIVIPLLACKNCDAKFFIIFEDGRLVEMEYHLDC